MRLKTIVLTIDDAPSKHTPEKIKYCVKNQISADLFCRGEHLAKYTKEAIYAIQQGFLLGNHSMTHPYFSHKSLSVCQKEISDTEHLIGQCYQAAGCTRSKKIIRMPFGDRGAGPAGRLASNEKEKKHVSDIQTYLSTHNFVKPTYATHDSYIDVQWDLDTQDYKKKHIIDPDMYLAHLDKILTEYPHEKGILLLHDFDHNHHLFEITCEHLKQCGVTYAS